MTPFPPLSAAPADLASLSNSDADATKDASSDQPSATDFDPRSNPGIKDSLKQRAWALDVRARCWHGADDRLRGQTKALLAWACELHGDDRARADELRSLHCSIELLPPAFLENRPPPRKTDALSRLGQAARIVREDLRILTSSKAGASAHHARPPTEQDLQQRLIKVDQELFRLEQEASKLASESHGTDQILAVRLRCRELQDLRTTFSAATRYCGPDASKRKKADALIRQVETQMTGVRLVVDSMSAKRA